MNLPNNRSTEPSQETPLEGTSQEVKRYSNFLERLWAFLTIKQALDGREATKDPAEAERLEEKALQLSLKYHFVTKLTSLIVVKPEQGKEEVEESRIDPNEFGIDYRGGWME